MCDRVTPVEEKDDIERIDSLDGLRGVAALAVVAYHYTGGTLHRLLPGGQFVTLFFIMSGLVLSIVPLRVGIGSYDWPRYQLRRVGAVFHRYLPLARSCFVQPVSDPSART